MEIRGFDVMADDRRRGRWDLLQELLLTLKGIADRYRVSIADVAIRYILDHPAVAGLIVGVRLGVAAPACDILAIAHRRPVCQAHQARTLWPAIRSRKLS